MSGEAAPGRPFDLTSGGLRLRVRLTPRGGRAGHDGVVQLADGRWVLRLRVAAPPVDGAANAAATALLAAALGLPGSRVTLAAGQNSRLKTFDLAGPPDDLAESLRAWIDQRR